MAAKKWFRSCRLLPAWRSSSAWRRGIVRVRCGRNFCVLLTSEHSELCIASPPDFHPSPCALAFGRPATRRSSPPAAEARCSSDRRDASLAFRSLVCSATKDAQSDRGGQAWPGHVPACDVKRRIGVREGSVRAKGRGRFSRQAEFERPRAAGSDCRETELQRCP